MGRLAAALIGLAQLPLLWLAFDATGTSAIWFTFVGTPLLAVGVVLGSWALARRLGEGELD